MQPSMMFALTTRFSALGYASEERPELTCHSRTGSAESLAGTYLAALPAACSGCRSYAGAAGQRG